MSRIELPVGPGTTALRVGRACSIVIGVFVMWAICTLLAPDWIPPWQVWLARVGLPVALAFYVVLFIWARREATQQPPHEFED